MKRKDLYVVTGTTINNGDRYSWDVMAFSDKKEADKLCFQLEETIDNFLIQSTRSEDLGGTVNFEVLEDLLKVNDPYIFLQEDTSVGYTVRTINYSGNG